MKRAALFAAGAMLAGSMLGLASRHAVAAGPASEKPQTATAACW